VSQEPESRSQELGTPDEPRCSNGFAALPARVSFSLFTGLMLCGRFLGPFHSQYLALAHVERGPNP
jgi:hypothetical protein